MTLFLAAQGIGRPPSSGPGNTGDPAASEDPAIVAELSARKLIQDPENEEAWAALKPYPNEHMVAWAVSTRVNKPANDDAALIEPTNPRTGE